MAESMSEQIFSIACALSKADESEKSMLRMICTAQEESLVRALKEGVAKEDCESAFICAAIESYSEDQLKRYATAVAAVGTKETVIEESGAAQYLGEKVDEATQETVSVYGRKMLLTLLIEVYAPRTLGAAGCEEAAETITQAMMTALPEGLKLGSLQWGKTGWDKTTGMFRLDASAKYAAYFVAEAAEDETVFTDFVLKGTVKERE